NGEHAPHLLHRLPAHRLDRAEGRGGLGRLGDDQMGADSCLDGDHAHGVGDYVVELSGDPGPFLGDGPLGQTALGTFQGGRLLLQFETWARRAASTTPRLHTATKTMAM